MTLAFYLYNVHANPYENLTIVTTTIKVSLLKSDEESKM